MLGNLLANSSYCYKQQATAPETTTKKLNCLFNEKKTIQSYFLIL